MAVHGTICDRTDEGGVRIFEGLLLCEYSGFFGFDNSSAYIVFFFTSKLAGCLEVDTKVREFPFVVLTDVLDGVDVERYREAMNWQYDSLCLAVYNNLWERGYL